MVIYMDKQQDMSVDELAKMTKVRLLKWLASCAGSEFCDYYSRPLSLIRSGLTILLLVALISPAAGQQTKGSEEASGEIAETTPEAQATDSPGDTNGVANEEAIPGKFQRKNLMVVPIPISSPTFGSGLILGGAYFYPQTDAEKAAQPASFTAGAVGYTSNDSWAVGAMQKNYWAEDKWRFMAMGGYADLKLELFEPVGESGQVSALDWHLRGGFFQSTLHRRIVGRWYGGVLIRYLKMTQDLNLGDIDQPIDFDSEISAVGVGMDFAYDSRDLPAYPHEGHMIEAQAISSEMSPSKRGRYQDYKLRFRTYHKFADNLVMAGEASFCTRAGEFPLWDACWLTLRGFPFTRYMAKTAYQAQAEARWTFSKRWGAVLFAGAGNVKDSIAAEPRDGLVPSYGAGIRFMVMQSQRINVRVDYGRSSDGEAAWYLSVTEAF